MPSTSTSGSRSRAPRSGSRSTARNLHYLRRHAARPAAVRDVPGMQRYRQCHPNGGRHALQPDLPQVRRHGKLRNVCPACHGDGRSPSRKPWKSAFPPAPNRVAPARRRKGQRRYEGCAAGDLYITVRVEEHPFFTRDGDNIEIKVPITVWEATWERRSKCRPSTAAAILKIPQGTQNGQRFRLREKGVLNSRKNSAAIRLSKY